MCSKLTGIYSGGTAFDFQPWRINKSRFCFMWFLGYFNLVSLALNGPSILSLNLIDFPCDCPQSLKEAVLDKEYCDKEQHYSQLQCSVFLGNVHQVFQVAYMWFPTSSDWGICFFQKSICI